MNILLVSATTLEIQPTLDFLEQNSDKKTFFDYEYQGHKITPLVTGVGQFMMGFALARYQKMQDVDLAINVGISGAFDRNIPLGTVVEVVEDRFADLGVEMIDGTFQDVYDLNLSDENLYPLKNGNVINEKPSTNLQKCSAITVNKAHGYEKSIAAIQSKYKANLESMEGAAFMYACKSMDVDFTQIKSISNYVEPRDKSKWKIKLAIDNLNEWLITYLNT